MTKRSGFTLIELAVVLALAGLMTTGGLILVPKLWHEKQRVESQKFLLAAKDALLTYAASHNALPLPDNSDLLPTVLLDLAQRDAYGHSWRYVVNSNLLSNTPAGRPCVALKEYFADTYLGGRGVVDFPRLWQQGMAETAGAGMPVAAVVVSRGANGELDQYFVDLNKNGIIEAGETMGDNATSDLVQAPPSGATFDDLVIALTIPELLRALPECRK